MNIFKDLKDAIVESAIEGWELGKTKRPNYIPPDQHEPPNVFILDEISTLETIIERQNEISKIIEKELELTYDPKKRAILLGKLNIIDRQSYKNRIKVYKLYERLKDG